MKVEVTPPRGKRLAKLEPQQVSTGEHIDELTRLARLGYTFRVPEIAIDRNVYPTEIANALKLGSTPRESQLDAKRWAVVEMAESKLKTLHADEREHWLNQLRDSIARLK